MNKPIFLPQTGSNPIRLELEIERELLRAYIDSANDGIFVVCDEMKFHVANPLLAHWLGISEAELTAHGHRLPITDFFCQPDTEKMFIEQFSAVLEGRASRFEMDIRPVQGAARWVEISLNRVRLGAGAMVIGVARDITERRELQIALQHQANHDDLTGLINRREFQLRLNALVATLRTDPGPHALIYIDLDQFKVVNDTCGHIAGDALLRQIGQRLGARIQSRDVIARLGGDEFGVLLHDVDIDQATGVAEMLCSEVAAHRFVWYDRRYDLTASIGLCAIQRDTQSAEEAMSAADAACYVAKDKGRNRTQIYFEGVACKGKRDEMQWVSRLQEALDENRFEVWQQRILNLGREAGKSTDHFEILLRLIDKDGRRVAPEEFFPSAERYGLMPAIDRWVITHLLANDVGKNLNREMESMSATHCAINLSGASLNDDKFLMFLEETLRHAAVAGELLCFEITETVAVTSFGRVREMMQAFKQFGCRFALDDFGSGMSSFSYLKNLPVDYLKIDGSLVRNIVTDAADFAMVEAFSHVGEALGIETVAEFVETETTLQCLREIGVDYAQGYVIHKPEPLFGNR